MLNPDRQTELDEASQGSAHTADHQGDREPSGWWIAFKTVVSSVLALVIIMAGVITMQRLVAARPEVPQRPQVERRIPVLTETVQLSTHRPTISVFGEIVTGRLVDLRALVGGEITAVHPDLEAGRRVNVGDTLIEIDTFSYRGAVVEAQANLDEALARFAEAEARIALEAAQLAATEDQLDLAQRDLERAQELASTGSLTERDLDTRILTVSQRQQSLDQRSANIAIEQARLDQQRASIERLEWRLSQARRDLERTALKAPFTGVVRSESVEPGRAVSSNDVLVTMFDDSALNVRFTLSDSQIGRIAAEDELLSGRPIRVYWSTGGDEIVLEGVIDRLDAQIAADTGGVALFGRIDQTGVAENLRPGAFVTVTLPDQAFEDTVRLPEAAIYETNHVFAVVDDRLQRRDVHIVAWDGTHLLVRAADGLSLDGAEIVTSRMANAGEGVAVERVAPDPTASANAS
ncbi:MAG: HlyD family efflux transporter periplasmic adaptor subunit [Pseudomonadota bacterium]